jgi:phosphoglycerate dehydrogenase-like enzyme
MTAAPVRVLIASALESEHVRRIAAVDPRIEVLHAPELLPAPRYAADHHGTPRNLTRDQREQWMSMLAAAQVSFDFDWSDAAQMPANCPELRWVQGTSSGIGEFLQRTGLGRSEVTFTTAAGIHAVPLAEFALTGLLYFVKGVPALTRWQAARRWERYTTRQLAGMRVLVIGLGHVGRKVADVLSAAGVEVWGVGRDGRADRGSLACATGISSLDDVLPSVDGVVLCCPQTPETEGLLSGPRIRLLPEGAIVVNISRGQVIDEPALIAALADGHLGGACLDVATVEPLPEDSPLWAMPSVLISPHSASTVASENAAITDLFCDNLRRWLGGEHLLNVYSRDKGY